MLTFLGFLVLPRIIFANITINEVFYDAPGSDKGGEWVEIYNDGSQAVDLSSYRFSEGGTNHKLKSAQGVSTVPALGYAVITNDAVTFKSSNPQFGGNLFESSFSLNNTGETIAIKDGKLIATDQFTYSSALGANSDGDSLQKFPDGWKPSKPTPGGENIFVVSAPKPGVSSLSSKKSVPLATISKLTSKKTSVAKPTGSNAKQTAAAVFSGSGGDGFFKWAIVLGGVIVAGALAFFLSPKRPKTEADEIDIIE